MIDERPVIPPDLKGHLIKSLWFLKEFTHLSSYMKAPYKELKSHA
ncbi:hypothetical protein P255_01444 [Acinetobacter brisouii CIP 110357]|uniref:Uncharacterized protein n=1 Tax=Acinetobacter brisouii CIP 110357 TaxID=1341683 RepID=V2VT80_9GAMM|nr:hypothetical protein F954_01149 [Acinetobacter brisouii ANC 4119]ESK50944.1 hypothetical protein P255_01444 [Acinetobacter brisouii CIP 110357]